jgi:cytoskeleton protein RodZ
VSVESGDDAESPGTSGLAAAGSRLSSARREQQREVAAVASALHLRPEVVEALEGGDESALPALTFVRGYIKAYARLLGLDEREVLAALPTDDSYRAQPLKAVGMRRKRTLRLPSGKWFFWLLLVASVFALITYGVPLIERMMDNVKTPEEDGSSLVLPLDAPAPDADAMLLPEFSGDTGNGEFQESESLENAVEEKPGEQFVQESVPAGDGITADVQPPVPVISATGPAEISMRFSEDSWVEMESHGRKLVVGTQRAGSERTVRAEPPIEILLGNAPGVEISYRGKVVDLQSYQRGKVARLVLED